MPRFFSIRRRRKHENQVRRDPPAMALILFGFFMTIPHCELETHKQRIHPRLAQCHLGNAADRRDDD
jgi:hypothetical protein